MTDTYKLAKPLQTHSGMIDELRLNSPKARAFIKYGIPFQHIVKGEGDDQEIKTVFEPKAIFGFLSDMTGHDQIILEGIEACDFMPLCWKVAAMIQNPSTPSA